MQLADIIYGVICIAFGGLCLWMMMKDANNNAWDDDKDDTRYKDSDDED